MGGHPPPPGTKNSYLIMGGHPPPPGTKNSYLIFNIKYKECFNYKKIMLNIFQMVDAVFILLYIGYMILYLFLNIIFFIYISIVN